MSRHNNRTHRITGNKKTIDIFERKNDSETSYTEHYKDKEESSLSLFLVKELNHHLNYMTAVTVCLEDKKICTK